MMTISNRFLHCQTIHIEWLTTTMTMTWVQTIRYSSRTLAGMMISNTIPPKQPALY
jgi:hypothetical protein